MPYLYSITVSSSFHLSYCTISWFWIMLLNKCNMWVRVQHSYLSLYLGSNAFVCPSFVDGRQQGQQIGHVSRIDTMWNVRQQRYASFFYIVHTDGDANQGLMGPGAFDISVADQRQSIPIHRFPKLIFSWQCQVTFGILVQISKVIWVSTLCIHIADLRPMQLLYHLQNKAG